jgi:hypothetical protein
LSLKLFDPPAPAVEVTHASKTATKWPGSRRAP